MKRTVKNQIKEARRIIKKFNELNGINFRFDIKINYKLGSMGLYNPAKMKNININPKLCSKRKELRKDMCAHGYVNSYEISDVIVHEYGHLLDNRKNNMYYKSLLKLPRIRINWNCDVRYEELIEIFVLYMINPYLLKLISPAHYKLQKTQFESPTPCTKRKFIEIYRTWNADIKRDCWRTWGILVSGNKIFLKNN